MGLITVGVALCTGELSAFMPVTGGFVRHATIFVQPALGTATGWNFWYTMAITAPAELVAAATIINFWDNSINAAVWYSVFIVIIAVLNFSAVRWYGEVSGCLWRPRRNSRLTYVNNSLKYSSQL